MAQNNTITVMEEIKRGYKTIHARARPIIDRVLTEGEMAESKRFMEEAAVEKMLKEDVDGEEGGWAYVSASNGVPAESNNEEEHRLATGIGPIEINIGVLREKISDVVSALHESALRVPGSARDGLETAMDKLAEGLGRVAFSEAAMRAVQRYSLLGRVTAAFERGKEQALRGRVERSPAHDQPPSQPTDSKVMRSTVDPGIEELEDVQIADEVEEGWEQDL